jgi:hypothetical protein
VPAARYAAGAACTRQTTARVAAAAGSKAGEGTRMQSSLQRCVLRPAFHQELLSGYALAPTRIWAGIACAARQVGIGMHAAGAVSKQMC